MSTRTAVVSPEELLRRAMAARSFSARARYAQRGLSTRAPLDATTHAMLLRQLYLAHYEGRRFHEAYEVAKQAVALDVMADVLLQDAARAALAAGDLEGALAHLRTAVRQGPASRRPFHLWTLGSMLFLAHRYDEAITALTRAARWGGHDRPLYRGHLALARIAGGVDPGELDDLNATTAALAEAPCGQGYGRFVLGHLAYAAGEWGLARRYLDAFVRRTEAARPVMAIALESELRMARATLGKIAAS